MSNTEVADHHDDVDVVAFLKTFNISLLQEADVPPPTPALFEEFAFEIFMLSHFNVVYLNWIKNEHYQRMYMAHLKLFYRKVSLWVRSGTGRDGEDHSSADRLQRWRVYRFHILGKSISVAFKYRRVLKIRLADVYGGQHIERVRVSVAYLKHDRSITPISSETGDDDNASAYGGLVEQQHDDYDVDGGGSNDAFVPLVHEENNNNNMAWMEVFNQMARDKPAWENLSKKSAAVSISSDARYAKSMDVDDEALLPQDSQLGSSNKVATDFRILSEFQVDFASSNSELICLSLPLSLNLNGMENCFQIEMLDKDGDNAGNVFTIAEASITGFNGLVMPISMDNNLSYTLQLCWSIEAESYAQLYPDVSTLVQYLDEFCASLVVLNHQFYWHFGRNFLNYIHQTEAKFEIISKLVFLPALLNGNELNEDLVPLLVQTIVSDGAQQLAKLPVFVSLIDLYAHHLEPKYQEPLFAELVAVPGMLEEALLDEPNQVHRIVHRVMPNISLYSRSTQLSVIVPMAARLLLLIATFQQHYKHYDTESRALKTKRGGWRQLDKVALEVKWKKTQSLFGNLATFDNNSDLVQVLMRMLVKSIIALRPNLWRSESIEDYSMNEVRKALETIRDLFVNADAFSMFKAIYDVLVNNQVLKAKQLNALAKATKEEGTEVGDKDIREA